MTTDGSKVRAKPLRVGQVLEGLLEDGANAGEDGSNAGEDEDASPVEASSGSATDSNPALPVAIWERMLAAVDLKFDGDNDGDVRGKG